MRATTNPVLVSLFRCAWHHYLNHERGDYVYAVKGWRTAVIRDKYGNARTTTFLLRWLDRAEYKRFQ